MDKINEFANMIRQCGRIVFFGGAGVSTESGVKDYRSRDGLYNTVHEYGVSPEEILSHTFFFDKTDVFYSFFKKYFIINAAPNAAHKALAKLEEMGKISSVITQNIDSLHQKAGSRNVIELHGTAEEFYCSRCGIAGDAARIIATIKSGGIPKCGKCGGIMKPKVVLYEEPLYDGVAEKASRQIAGADMLIVGGTSLAVYPAASFIRYFRGKYIVIINKTETDFDNNADLIFREKIGEVFDAVMKRLA